MRLIGTFTLMVALGMSAALAQDPIQGNWEGTFTSQGWEGRAVSAQVIAVSEVGYRVNLFVLEGEAAVKNIVTGKREHKHAKQATFEGKIDLGQALGGEYTVAATAEDGAMTGRFTGAGTLEFRMEKVMKESPTLGAAPPAGAAVLFDGSNADSWQRHPLTWNLVDNEAMEVCPSNLVTKQEFGSCRLHIEFRTPFMPNATGQARGNSGVYLQGRYEVQVLDSFGDDPADNLCGGIYKVAVPIVSASLPPLEWQTYDIVFHAAQFDAAGQKTRNARITVEHNGILIHDDVELPTATGGAIGPEAPAGPLMLQNHGDPVRFRNIWIVALD